MHGRNPHASTHASLSHDWPPAAAPAEPLAPLPPCCPAPPLPPVSDKRGNRMVGEVCMYVITVLRPHDCVCEQTCREGCRNQSFITVQGGWLGPPRQPFFTTSNALPQCSSSTSFQPSSSSSLLACSRFSHCSTLHGTSPPPRPPPESHQGQSCLQCTISVIIVALRHGNPVAALRPTLPQRRAQPCRSAAPNPSRR